MIFDCNPPTLTLLEAAVRWGRLSVAGLRSPTVFARESGALFRGDLLGTSELLGERATFEPGASLGVLGLFPLISAASLGVVAFLLPTSLGVVDFFVGALEEGLAAAALVLIEGIGVP